MGVEIIHKYYIMIDCKDNVGGDLRNAEKYGEPSKAFGDNKQPAVTHVS